MSKRTRDMKYSVITSKVINEYMEEQACLETGFFLVALFNALKARVQGNYSTIYFI